MGTEELKKLDDLAPGFFEPLPSRVRGQWRQKSVDVDTSVHLLDERGHCGVWLEDLGADGRG